MRGRFINTSMEFTKEDKERFGKLKETVESGQMHAMAWGKALVEIDKHEYWRIDKAGSMHAWAEDHCPMAYLSIQNAMRRLGDVRAKALIADTTGEPIVSKPKRTRAENKTVRNDTSSHTTKENLSTPEPPKAASVKHPKVEDNMGTVIPEPILEIWNRRAEIEELMAAVSKVKCLVANRRKEEDPLFMKIDQSAIGRLEQIHFLFSEAMPHAVCGVCEGRLEILKDNICGACKSTGFMSKGEYNRLVPEEKQTIRAKGIELRKARGK